MNLFDGKSGRIFAYGQPVDMRKGFHGLEELIVRSLGENPLSGDVFVFISRTRRLLKCFLWDRTGYVIVSKRLEHGRFRVRGERSKIELDTQRLKLIFDGIHMGGM